MNPEFQRNLWIEMTPLRLAMMVGILVLAFFAAAVPSSFWPDSTQDVARTLYYFIVVLWGTRNAALSVVGEIRDRTWDFQRLSSLSPGDMTWGKLFGSTVYNWFGGAICLGVVVVSDFLTIGAGEALLELAFAVSVGVMAQGASFLASLIAIRRRQTHTRRDVFLYQAIGLVAAGLAYYLWLVADPRNLLSGRETSLHAIGWWGTDFDARAFLLVSLVLLLGWIVTGCHRAMRIELKLRNGPIVWIGFLVFMGIYVAGFDLQYAVDRAPTDPLGLRLAMTMLTYGVLTYVMVLLEPKDRVHLRWLWSQLVARNFASLLNGLQAWMVSYIATIPLMIAVMLRVNPEKIVQALAIVAMFGFLTRDLGLFILMQTRNGKRSGDFMAVASMLALYLLLPSIFNGLGLQPALFLLYPVAAPMPWLGVAAPWIEACVVLGFAFRRLALPETQPARK